GPRAAVPAVEPAVSAVVVAGADVELLLHALHARREHRVGAARADEIGQLDLAVLAGFDLRVRRLRLHAGLAKLGDERVLEDAPRRLVARDADDDEVGRRRAGELRIAPLVR